VNRAVAICAKADFGNCRVWARTCSFTTGGMSVDPHDVTRFAIRELGTAGITYCSAVLPGAMFLIAYLDASPILGIPACGIYAETTIFDLLRPRVLAGERTERKEVAARGYTAEFC
jgi:molybdopterin biosynthesis enzyme